MARRALEGLPSDALADLLVDGPAESQAYARRLLEDRSDVDAQLARLLREREPATRMRLLRTLDTALGPRVADEVVRLLDDADASTRKAAANALGVTRHAPALPALAVRLRDSDPGVREQAIWALGQIADDRAVVPLAEVLAEPEADFRRLAVEALGRIGAPAAAALEGAVRDPDEDVRAAAGRALRRVREQAALQAGGTRGSPRDLLVRTWLENPTLNPGSESYTFRASGRGYAEDFSMGLVRGRADFDYAVEGAVLRLRFVSGREATTPFAIERTLFDHPAEGRLASLALTLEREPYFVRGGTNSTYYSLL
jgi:hypothetical protein